MTRVFPSHRRTVLLIGLLLGLMHLPLSVEIAVSLAGRGVMVQTLLLALYPVALALTGIGAALAQARLPLAGSTKPIRLAGVAALLFLLVVLQFNVLGQTGVQLALTIGIHLLVLGAWFLLLGFALAGAIAQESDWGTGAVGPAWAIHLIGLVIGYLVSDQLVVIIGPNAMILAAGLSLIVLPRWGVGLMGALLIVFGLTDADSRIEHTRDLDDWEESVYTRTAGTQGWSDRQLSELLESTEELDYLGWGRYGQVRVLRASDDRRLVLYNLKRQYDVSPFEVTNRLPDDAPDESGYIRFRLRKALYSLFRPDQRLLFIGVGSGRGMRHLDYEPNKSITMVERDPAAARFFAEFRPDFNGGLFSKVDFRVADGRHVVETYDGKLDAIVLESARFQPPHSMLPATSPSYIFTQQAIETYLGKLTPEGILVFEFSRTREKRRMATAAVRVLASLEALDVPHQVFRTGRRQSVMLMTCPTEGCLERWKEQMGAKKLDEFSKPWNPTDRLESSVPLTDESPFVGWHALNSEHRYSLYGMAGGLVGLGLLGMGLLSRRRSGAGWNAIPYCFVVGVAHAAVTMHTFYAWRAFYGDELLTILRLLVYFLLYGALGSACTTAVARRLPSRAMRVGATVLVLLVHLAIIEVVPFEEPSRWMREIFGALAILPAGFALGVYLPMGLGLASREDLGRNLCADSLGALVAYALLYLIYLPLGGSAYAALGILLYVGAAAMLRTKP